MDKNFSSEEFKKSMSSESTNYLKHILEIRDPLWTNEKLEIIEKILIERGVELPKDKKKLLAQLLISSTDNLQDRVIVRYLGIVSAQVVLGSGFLTELDGQVSDFFGVRAGGFQKKLLTARDDAIGEICEQVIEKSGNAIIGLDIDFMTLSSNLLMVSVNGTAVEYEPKKI